MISVLQLGTIDYASGLRLQEKLVGLRKDGRIGDALILLEHTPVITLGRNAKSDNVLASPELLAQRGVEAFECDRGGDVTFHGPGQLVGYPIVDLKRHRLDLHWYLRRIEEALILALADLGIPAERNPTFTGVWTRGRKIASIGVHARDWVTWHGFALNVTTDLSYFDLIIPCGIDGVVMTSIARELGIEQVSAQDVRDRVSAKFGECFDLTPVMTSHATLMETVG